MTGSSDKITSPVHGQLDGVFFHAMAFVNLVALDKDYWRSPKAIENCLISENCGFSRFDLIQTFLQAIVLGISIYFKNHRNIIGSETNTSPISNFMVFLLLSVIVSAFVLYVQEKGGPANWIALASIIIASGSMLFKPFLISVKEEITSRLPKWLKNIHNFTKKKAIHLKQVVLEQPLFKRR
ncbi:hypothetical protein QTO05_20110 [Vibrio fortis]|uniref:hypothetical protein n=1 Tax=Vibrio fortis TaxID=212667 RepID=UPI002F3F981D